MPNGIPSRRRQISTTATGSSETPGDNSFGALDEEGRGGGVGFGLRVQGRHRPQMFVGRPQAFPAGRENLDRCRAREDRLDHVGGRVQDVLAVVEHQQPRTSLQRRSHTVGQRHPGLLGDAKYACDRIGHCCRIGDRG